MSAPITNAFGQPVGQPLPGWAPPPHPERTTLSGRYCRVEPMHAGLVDDLYDAMLLDEDQRHWTYLPYGPFATREAYREWVHEWASSNDPLLFAITSVETSKPVGLAAYLRIAPASASIEVGHLFFSQHLRKRPAATEAMFLMMGHAFALGYRRYEWKCDVFNEPSRAAAERLGFTFEGIFRQATVYKGRTRDTAWYSVIDEEWPRLSRAFESWLDPTNFDSTRSQRRSLASLREPPAAR